MKKQKTLWPALLMVYIMALWPFAGCEKDPLVVDADLSQIEGVIGDSLNRAYWEQVAFNARQFDSLACGTLTRPADPPHMDEPQLLSGPTTTLQNGVRCVTRSYRWQLGDQSAFLYDPTADVFFPTNVLDGTSIQTGAYRPIVAPISPKVLSVSLENVGGSPKITVDTPTLGNVREGVAQLLRQLAPVATPARVSMVLEEVHSSEQTSVAVRANYKGFGAKVNAAFDWNSSEAKSRFLLNFLQVYYTLDMDITHTSPSDYFVAENLPNMADFNEGMPVYVSSIKYGRQIMFAVESSRSASEVRAALQASYNSVAFGGGGLSISAQHQQTLQQSKISAFVVGGSGAVATQNITNAASLLSIMIAGGNYSADSPGAPLAYTLRYLCDNSIAKIALAAEYTVRECVEVGVEYNFTPTNNGGNGYYYCALHANPNSSDGEFGGNGPLVQGTITLYPSTDNTQIWCHVNVTWTEQGGNGTLGRVDQRFHLHALPPGKQFLSFPASNAAYFEYTDIGTAPDFPSVTGGNFVAQVRLIGDTAGNDLGCDGDADANIRFHLNPIKIMVKNL